MKKLFVAHNVVHLQMKPSNGAERVSQARMGQAQTVLREENGWVWVEGEDTYRGWCDLRWLVEDDGKPRTQTTAIFTAVRTAPRAAAPLIQRLSIRSGVHVTDERKDGFVRVELPGIGSAYIGERTGWVPEVALAPLPAVPAEKVGETVVAYGREFQGTPYLWGGSSSFGLDCSGFVQLCYELAGVPLRRDADIQRDDPRFVPVVPAEEQQPDHKAEWDKLKLGDLVFFGKPDKITHIGMHFGNNTFIHAAGGAGVIVSEWGDPRYSPGYVDARRLNPARMREPVTRYESDTR